MEIFSEEDAKFKSPEEFRSAMRKAFRAHFEKQGMPAEVAAGFGDASAFYCSLSGLPWKVGTALGSAGYFYPNEIVEASDMELLAIDGVGAVGLSKIRGVFESRYEETLSVVDYMNRLTGEDYEVPFPLPRHAQLMEMGE